MLQTVTSIRAQGRRTKARALDDPVRDGEVESDTAALGADQYDFRPTGPAEIGKRRLARLAPHLPVVPQVQDALSRQQRL
jgi:hypothetical protein